MILWFLPSPSNSKDTADSSRHLKSRCDCVTCVHEFFPIALLQPSVKTLCEEDAKNILRTYTRSLSDDREELTQKLVSHGDVIVNLWKKMSPGKRRQCLLRVDPNLYHSKWFLPSYPYSHYPPPPFEEIQARRKTCLLPYLNVEVLKRNPVALFTLLHNRTHYSPETWAPHDDKQLDLSWNIGFFEIEHFVGYVVMHGSRYGELTNGDVASARRADIIGFPRARLILEAQACLIGFLLRLVNQILNGFDGTPSSSTKWNHMISMGFKQSVSTELWSTYTNQSFSAPPVFDIDYMLSIAQTRLDATGDHLRLLQTFPAYLRQYMRDVARGIFSNESPLAKQLMNEIQQYQLWDFVRGECQNVKKALLDLGGSIEQGHPLPPAYDRALCALEVLLLDQIDHQADRLGATIRQRPGFMSPHTYKPDLTLAVYQKMTTEEKIALTLDYFMTAPLDWCLKQLQYPKDNHWVLDHAMLFTFLDEHLSACSATERARVDQLVYDELANHAASHEILALLYCHRPKFTYPSQREVTKPKKRQTWEQIGIDNRLTSDDWATVEMLLEDFCSIQPPGGKKDHLWLQNTHKHRTAQENVWTKMRECLHKILQDNFCPQEIEAALEIVSSNLAPGYTADVRAEREAVLINIARKADLSTMTPQTRRGDHPTSKAPKAKGKAKRKTCPPQQLAPNETNETISLAPLTIDDLITNPVPKILITARALRIIALMFPTCSEEVSKTIEWSAFVAAMVDMGFGVTNGAGSAVIFEGQEQGKIVFHRPHPVAKIDPIMIQAMGKRMAKNFGWYRDLFVLQEAGA